MWEGEGYRTWRGKKHEMRRGLYEKENAGKLTGIWEF
jgi:hypothetical protein